VKKVLQVLQLASLPGRNPVGKKGLSPDSFESLKAGQDFAAVLMGLMIPQTPLPVAGQVGQPEPLAQQGNLTSADLLLTEDMLSEVFTAHLEQSQIPPGFLLTEEATDDLVGETLGNKAGEGTNQLFETVLDGKLTELQSLSKQDSAGNKTLLESEGFTEASKPKQTTVRADGNPELKPENMESEGNQLKQSEIISQFKVASGPFKPTPKEDGEQQFTWQPVNGTNQMNTAETADMQPEKALLPKQLESVIHQLVDKSKVTIGQGKSEIEIKLKPEYLGKVHLKVSLEKGVIVAKLAVENVLVGKALENNLAQLKNQMAEQGLNFSQVNVETGSGTLDQNPKESFYRQEQFGGFSSGRASEDRPEEYSGLSLDVTGVNYLA
jgi:flagellar hook-length control protein FliK